MGQAVRAIYEQGRLRLLDPVNLTEGQEIELIIISDRERAYTALGDLLIRYEPESENEIDETRLMAELDAALQGKPSVSDVIIRERREGP
jgi:predicted DNA-binding antitoxin AbrB/MazE fold protein